MWLGANSSMAGGTPRAALLWSPAPLWIFFSPLWGCLWDGAGCEALWGFWRHRAGGQGCEGTHSPPWAVAAGAGAAGTATASCFLTFYSSRDRNGICLRLGITSCDCAGEGQSGLLDSCVCRAGSGMGKAKPLLQPGLKTDLKEHKDTAVPQGKIS